MNEKKLDIPDIIAIVSVAVFFIATLLPWFEVSFDFPDVGGVDFDVPSSETGNGWDVGFLWSGIPLLLGLAMLFLMLAPKFIPDLNLPDLPPFLPLVLGGIAAFLVLLKLIIGEDAGVPGILGDDAGVEVSRSFGIFIAFLAAAGMAVAGFLKFQEAQKRGGLGGPGSPPPPPNAPPQQF